MKTSSIVNRIWLIGVVVIAAASARAQTGAVQTFTSPTYGYSVSVPADWQRVSDAEIQGLIARVHQGPNTRDLAWDAMYRAPAPAFAAVRYPYVIFQVQPYTSARQPTESDLEQAVSAISGNNFRKEAVQTSDAMIKHALESASIGPARYDPVNHVMVQDLSMNVAGAGQVQASLVHHFGRHAMVSVMCYDQKASFARHSATFDQITSSFAFDASGRYDHSAVGLGPRAVLVGVLVLLVIAAVVIILVVLAARRRQAPALVQPPFPAYPPHPQYPPQYPPGPPSR